MHRDDIKWKNPGGDNCAEHTGHSSPCDVDRETRGRRACGTRPCDVERNAEAAAGFCLHDGAVGRWECVSQVAAGYAQVMTFASVREWVVRVVHDAKVTERCA